MFLRWLKSLFRTENSIRVLHPGSGRIIPLHYSGWWVRYPEPGCTLLRMEPDPDLRPEFHVGEQVRLRGKPEKLREIQRVDWHGHRYRYVYIVTTSAGESFSPYWFAEQLVRDADFADEP